jgi:hypothetical protein
MNIKRGDKDRDAALILVSGKYQYIWGFVERDSQLVHKCR